MHDPSFGMMKVTVKLWWTMSRLANSTRGMRWPNPGDGTSAGVVLVSVADGCLSPTSSCFE